MSLETTILIYAAFNLIAALISYPAGSLSDRWGRRNILLASYFVFFVAYLGFAVTQNALLIGILFIVYGLYQGVFAPSVKRWLPILCQSKCGRAALVGTTPRSEFCNLCPA